MSTTVRASSASRAPARNPVCGASESARRRFLERERVPLFVADWERALFVHFAVPLAALQPHVPFALDERDGEAHVSLVAFTMRRLRFARGGRLGEWICRPAANLRLLNLRTYVVHEGEPGIHFIAEWINSWTQTQLGPPLYSLPYRWGELEYHHEPDHGVMHGRVTDRKMRSALEYVARLEIGGAGTEPLWQPCAPGSLDDFLLERYTAFNGRPDGGHRFRIRHEPWPQCPADVHVTDQGLLARGFPWWQHARLVGANFSPAVRDVWMGYPRSMTAAMTTAGPFLN
ncbi:MAG TPA: DUF2071 domain-containing protein [Verrucomicrobiae bacterium]|nr:DUF2071 domain-containing protein [Verrucomicrobiae bacterium]